MLKRIIAIMIIAAICVGCAACGTKNESPKTENPTETTTEALQTENTPTQTQTESKPAETEEPSTSAPEEEEDRAWSELAALGKIETENGIATVKITLPAELYGDGITQEELDALKIDAVSAKVNDDGTVTVVLTKKQHREMMQELEDTIEEALQKMIEEGTFENVEHDRNYSSFDVTITSDSVSMMEAFMALAFYMYGGMYGIFSGHENDNVTVNYYDLQGNLLESYNSADMAE